ncbi:hypothetical protein [Streptomyces sp. NPDC053431]
MRAARGGGGALPVRAAEGGGVALPFRREGAWLLSSRGRREFGDRA